jgi:hypothetical protein
MQPLVPEPHERRPNAGCSLQTGPCVQQIESRFALSTYILAGSELHLAGITEVRPCSYQPVPGPHLDQVQHVLNRRSGA